MIPIDSSTIDQLEKYINGNLTSMEKEIIEKRLINEPELKEWLLWLQETTHGMADIVVAEKKKLVKDWLLDDKKIEQSDQKRIKPILFLVFIVSVILVTTYYVFNKTTVIDPPTFQLVYKYLDTPYKNPTVFRNEESSNWYKSIVLYTNRDYSAFIIANLNLIEDGLANNEQKFYIALANLYNSPPNQELAIKLFTELINTNSGYEDLALWYRSLAYLSKKDIENAKIDLKLIISRSKYNVKEAQELLESL